MWYEAWDMVTENTSTSVAPTKEVVYFHGFIAPTTGDFTSIKIRVREANYISGNAQTDIYAAIYKSNNNQITPQPTDLMNFGRVTKIIGPGLEDEILTIPLNGIVQVTRDNIYYIAILYTATNLNNIKFLLIYLMY